MTGPVLQQATNTIHAAKSCSTIIYDAGYLVIKDDTNSNYIQTYFLPVFT